LAWKNSIKENKETAQVAMCLEKEESNSGFVQEKTKVVACII
jgi:hypothetical protein